MKLALMSMPFNSMMNPSLQAGLLKAVVNQHGFAADTWHLNMELARQMGFRAYEIATNPVIPTVCEWLASYSLFGDLGSEREFIHRYGDTMGRIMRLLDWSEDDFIQIRRELVPKFLDWCMERVPWSDYDVVGFTSTYQQQIISLALAKRVKERHPDIQIVFGGANVLGPMGREHIRAWPWIDHVCMGEGDHTLPELLRRLDRRDLGDGVKGFLHRVGDRIVDPGPATMLMDMDSLPDPDYDEYFQRSKEVGFVYEEVFPGTMTALPIETARGCWWGHKHHCTFCGLPALGMKFRSRTIPNVIAQLDRMSRRYNTWSFMPVDNIIDPTYIKDLFGALAAGGYDYQLWYEAKANLTPDQLRQMANGGLTHIQPGIESLSSHVLKIMDKGTTGLTNVNTIKWARYHGLTVTWNILSGFPGETEEDYVQILDRMKKMVHLQPPGFSGRIWLQRFSPYFEHPERYPIHDQRPFSFYRYIYPEDRVNTREIAYWYEYEMDGTVPDEVTQPIRDHIRDWQALWEKTPRPDLFYLKAVGRIRVVDARDRGAPASYDLSGDVMHVFEYCMEKPRGLRSIGAYLTSLDEAPSRIPVEMRVRTALHLLVERGIVLEEDGHYLSIALPVHKNQELHPVSHLSETVRLPDQVALRAVERVQIQG